MDLETTGLNPKTDRIIQIHITVHYPDKDPIRWTQYVDPGFPIPNTDKHKVTDEMVAGMPKFEDLAHQIAKVLSGCDLGGYNVLFDLEFIKEQMARVGVPFEWDNHVIDPFAIFKRHRGHNLTNCYLEYGGENGQPLPPDTEINAHDAEFDIMMTETSLKGQLLRYENLPRTVPELAAFCFPKDENGVDTPVRGQLPKFVWMNGEAAFNFGKWKGKTIRELIEMGGKAKGYLHWMRGPDANFSDEVKQIVEDCLNGDFPVKP